MSWRIERRGRVAVVTMNTNKVNAQNRAFFADLHGAFDVLERDHAESPVVLIGQRGRFSAGLDLDEHFRLFAGDRDSVTAWFADYRATNMRLFTYPRPTVAAVNGHAYAGGLITAAVCDYRVAISDWARFGLNEVPIGIPMPAAYVRMLAYAWGEPVAARACLLGEIFDPRQALGLGMFQELADGDQLLERAVAVAEMTLKTVWSPTPSPNASAQAAVLRHRRARRPVGPGTPRRDDRRTVPPRHTARDWEQLKGSPAPW